MCVTNTCEGIEEIYFHISSRRIDVDDTYAALNVVNIQILNHTYITQQYIDINLLQYR
jgi:hypothetical protein